MEEGWLLGEQSTAGGGGGEEGDGDGAASLGLGPVGLDLGGVGGGGQGMEVDGVDLDLEMDADQAIDPFALAELGHVVSAMYRVQRTAGTRRGVGGRRGCNQDHTWP